MILNVSRTRNIILMLLIIFGMLFASWYLLEQRKGNSVPDKAELVYSHEMIIHQGESIHAT